MRKPLFTKSRHKIGKTCPTKLYYTGQKQYYNAKLRDTNFQFIAHQGDVVGELAKAYFPGGYEIQALGYDESLEKTRELLQKNNVIIYEAAFRYEDFFVRADILIKNGDEIELIEVKSKTYRHDSFKGMLTQKNEIRSDWRPYIEDIAFQEVVLKKALPAHYNISASLLLLNRHARTTVSGLHSRFAAQIGKKSPENQPKYTLEDKKAAGAPILIRINVNELTQQIFNETQGFALGATSFEDEMYKLAGIYRSAIKAPPKIDAHCANCEFRYPRKNLNGLLCGFRECWQQALGWKAEDFQKPLIFEIWNFPEKEKFMAQGKFFLQDLRREDFISREQQTSPDRLTDKERQWIQVEKTRQNDPTPYIELRGLQAEMEKWQYPLHFIDFETTTAAVPFNQNARPFEPLAFQFSHHLVYADGTIEHKGQYININKGEFPNFDFVRELKNQLDKDQGTVFRYAAHENTILNSIFYQLKQADPETVPDKQVLSDWIKNLTRSLAHAHETWLGKRNMIDLYQVIKKYLYLPQTKGSISIKDVLPAVLNQSRRLQEKYARPVYGSEKGIKSLNFQNWTWITQKGTQVENPYNLLPAFALKRVNLRVANGTDAMHAYTKAQCLDLQPQEKEALEKALLKYCELDTFAMVLIFEYLHQIAKKKSRKKIQNRNYQTQRLAYELG